MSYDPRHPGDGLPDDRILCSWCSNCDLEAERCRRLHVPVTPVPRRCLTFKPVHSHNDQRTGLERWPTMATDIEEARALDRARGV